MLPLCLLLLLAGPPDVAGLPAWAAPSAPASEPASAASPGGPGTTPGTPSPPPTQVPVDGGLGLLALAGAGYAARRLARRP